MCIIRLLLNILHTLVEKKLKAVVLVFLKVVEYQCYLKNFNTVQSQLLLSGHKTLLFLRQSSKSCLLFSFPFISPLLLLPIHLPGSAMIDKRNDLFSVAPRLLLCGFSPSPYFRSVFTSQGLPTAEVRFAGLGESSVE